MYSIEGKKSAPKMNSIAPLGSEFDNFLFAPIGEDKWNGAQRPLSFGAIGRRPLGGGQELARLPGETATRRLVTLIGALPDAPLAHLEPGTVATRLIALLPHRTGSNIASRETLFGISAVSDPRRFIYAIVIFIPLLPAASPRRKGPTSGHIWNCG
jgi:hypothetical protein